jgi:glycosyltransferase involved in cell wall biosynthesis
VRILQVAPVWESVPPPAYGGTEAVVSLLTEGLVARGVDVTLCASGDSKTRANLSSICEQGLRAAPHPPDPAPTAWLHVAHALSEGRSYDLVHNHAGELGMAMSLLVDVPVLTTMHCAISDDSRPVWNHYSGWYNTVSMSQARSRPDVPSRFAGAVPNAIDVDSFPFSEDKDGYLLFMSRLSPEKGPHVAIEVARRLGMKLIMAGKVDAPDRVFYEQTIEPLIDGEQVIFTGEADARRKRDLYMRARCMLLPLGWDEPFGLVMAESMACGTPVIAFSRGAAPEIIVDGRTGFLVTDVDDMAAAVRRIDEIDPAECRAVVEARFNSKLMVERYVRIYERILDERRPAVAASRAQADNTGASALPATAASR